MKKLNYLLSITLTSLFLTINTFADQKNNFEMKKWGLGLHMEQIKTIDINTKINSTSPPNKIILTLNLTNNIRIEPQLGITWYNKKEQEETGHSIFMGVGGFGMLQKGNANFYGGVRLEYATLSTKENYDNEKETKTLKRYMAGPIIGVEYFINQHVSFGGEIGIKYINLNTDSYPLNSTTSLSGVNHDFLISDTGLLLRIYF